MRESHGWRPIRRSIPGPPVGPPRTENVDFVTGARDRRARPRLASPDPGPRLASPDLWPRLVSPDAAPRLASPDPGPRLANPCPRLRSPGRAEGDAAVLPDEDLTARDPADERGPFGGREEDRTPARGPCGFSRRGRELSRRFIAAHSITPRECGSRSDATHGRPDSLAGRGESGPMRLRAAREPARVHHQHRDVGWRHAGDAPRLADRGGLHAPELVRRLA